MLDLIMSAIQYPRTCDIILMRALLVLVLSLGGYQVPIGTAHAQAQDPMMKIFFIDVQGGASSLVILPNGKTLLIDGGTQSIGGAILVKFLQEQNITRVDTILATHAHRDHIGGLIDVINRFPVGEVLDPGIKVTGYPYDDFISAINSSNAQYKAVREGDEIILDPSVKIEVLNPPRSLSEGFDATYEDRDFLNNFSVIIKLSYGEFSILFPGDILSTTQEQFLDKPLDVNVLVAPHHGSSNSQNLQFLLATSPEVVILSPGLGSEEALTQDTFDKLEFAGVQQIVNTASEGTALLVTDGHMITIQTDETNRTITIPEFNNIQIIFVIAIGIILIPILIIQYSKKPIGTK